MHGSTSESSVCDFMLLELLTLVASRNTTKGLSYRVSDAATALLEAVQICGNEMFALQ